MQYKLVLAKNSDAVPLERSGVTLAMYHRFIADLGGLSTYGLKA